MSMSLLIRSRQLDDACLSVPVGNLVVNLHAGCQELGNPQVKPAVTGGKN